MGVRAREKVLWFFGQNTRVMVQNVVDVGFFVSLVAGEDTGLTCKVLEALPSLPFRYTYNAIQCLQIWPENHDDKVHDPGRSQ